MQAELFQEFKKQPFKETVKTMEFQGSDIDQERDGNRLKKQIWRIYELMKDQKWRSLSEISKLANAPEASASAQLRNLKKLGHKLNKKHLGHGFYKYQLIPNE